MNGEREREGVWLDRVASSLASGIRTSQPREEGGAAGEMVNEFDDS
jgi:hypothetical protein